VEELEAQWGQTVLRGTGTGLAELGVGEPSVDRGVFFLLWWFVVIRQMQGGGKQAMAFGRSKAKLQWRKNKKSPSPMWRGATKRKKTSGNHRVS
jgi:hypothetical protein